MTILGIDPGTSIIGYGAIKENGNEITCLDYGVLKIEEKDQAGKLLAIDGSINRLLKKVRPDFVVLEKLFFFKNHKTALSVAEARGVIILALKKNRIDFTELTPLELKRYLAGYGRASKEGIQKMLKLVLNLEKEPSPDDAADALALALLGRGAKRGLT